MTSAHRKTTISIALFLIFCLTHVYVMAGFVEPQITAAIPQTQQKSTGKLITSGSNPVLVNGNKVQTGMTILSGATLEIPVESVADVKVGLVGSVYLAAETKATLDFNRSSIKVNLIEGCVSLNTSKETSGAVYTSEGRVAASETGRDSTLDICAQSDDKSSAATAQETEKEILEKEREAFKKACGDFICNGLFGLCKDSLKWIIPVSIGAIVIPIAIKRGRNPSPSSP